MAGVEGIWVGDPVQFTEHVLEMLWVPSSVEESSLVPCSMVNWQPGVLRTFFSCLHPSRELIAASWELPSPDPTLPGNFQPGVIS